MHVAQGVSRSVSRPVRNMLRASLVPAVVLSVTATVSAEMSSWTQGGADAGRSGYVGGSLTLDPLDIEPAWTVELGFSQSGTGSWSARAVATDGAQVYRVALSGYAPGGDYHVMALDIDTGQENWDTIIKGSAFKGVGEPVIAQGKVWVNHAGHSANQAELDKPQLYSLNTVNGQVESRTTYSAQHGESDRPTTDGTLLVAQAGYYGGMSAFRADDGGTLWNVSGSQSVSPAAALTDQYFFAYDEGVYSRTTGAFIKDVTDPDGYSLRNPTVNREGGLFYRTPNGVSAFDSVTLGHRWNLDLGESIRAMAVGDGKVVVFTPNWVRVLDDSTGAEIQNYFSASEIVYGEIALTDSHVFLQDIGHTIAVDLETGDESWRVDDRGEMALGDGYLFLSNHAGIRAYAVPEPGSLLALVGLGTPIFLHRRK